MTFWTFKVYYASMEDMFERLPLPFDMCLEF